MTETGSAPAGVGVPSRERILAVARREFAERGFGAARLTDIAAAAGLSHPTLLYHFASKENLYRAVIEAAVADWAAQTRTAISTGLRGFDQVASLLAAGFEFFEAHQDFVRIVRRETIEGGGRLDEAMADVLRPFLDDAVAFLDAEVAAGRLRAHDPRELIELCYGAVLTYFADARFRARLLGVDPLAPAEIGRHRDALVGLLRSALEPADQRSAVVE